MGHCAKVIVSGREIWSGKKPRFRGGRWYQGIRVLVMFPMDIDELAGQFPDTLRTKGINSHGLRRCA